MTASHTVSTWTIAEAAAACDFQLVGDGSALLAPPWIDTRTLPHGALWVALASRDGERHGAPHWRDAVEAGAGALLFGSDVTDTLVAEVCSATDTPVLRAVDHDGWRALGVLARAWRRRCGFQVVGITGSSGKTSTKDLLAGLLQGAGETVAASLANRNNELGVPITLLEAAPDTDVVICEMGMRARGEIAYLCDIAEPDVTILTNAGSAHLELLGTVEAIAAAKAEVIAGTRADGTAVVPAAQPWLVDLAGRHPRHVVTFGGVGSDADLCTADVERSESGIRGHLFVDGERRAFALPVHGIHQATNLAAAVAAAIALRGTADDIDLRPAALALSGGRGDRAQLEDGTLVIDDAYNANPDSMRAALDELAAVADAARRVAVLGFMAELGPTSGQLHLDIGATAGNHLDIHTLVVVATQPEAHALAAGWEARGRAPALVFATVDDAIARMHEWQHPGDAVLVKASNSVGLGRIADAIVESGVAVRATKEGGAT